MSSVRSFPGPFCEFVTQRGCPTSEEGGKKESVSAPRHRLLRRGSRSGAPVLRATFPVPSPPHLNSLLDALLQARGTSPSSVLLPARTQQMLKKCLTRQTKQQEYDGVLRPAEGQERWRGGAGEGGRWLKRQTARVAGSGGLGTG